MLADFAAATFFATASYLLMLTDAGAAKLFISVALSLMLAEAAAATWFTVAPPFLVLADLASATFYTTVVGLGNFLSVELCMPLNIMVRGCMECIDVLQGVRHRARRLIINMSRRESCKHHSSQIFTSVCD